MELSEFLRDPMFYGLIWAILTVAGVVLGWTLRANFPEKDVRQNLVRTEQERNTLARLYTHLKHQHDLREADFRRTSLEATSLREGPTHTTRTLARFNSGDAVEVLEKTSPLMKSTATQAGDQNYASFFMIAEGNAVPSAGSDLADTILRQGGHLALHFVLFLAAWRAGAASFGRTRGCIFALVYALANALLDEVYQMTVPGRNANLEDVLTNITGVLLGFVVVRCWKRA